jgi:Domain of unknown function (DUF4192)
MTSDTTSEAVEPDAAEKVTIRVGSPGSLLATVPMLLGFEPGDKTLVVVGAGPDNAEVKVTLRYDLPDDVLLAPAVAQHAAAALSDGGITRAVAVGYGPEQMVSPFADALRTELPQAGITVAETLRAENARYWSYVHTGPAEGTPFDATPSGHPGLEASPVLASRQALKATVAAVTGDEAGSMRKAIDRAVLRSTRLGDSYADPISRRSAVLEPGLKVVTEAIVRYRNGEQFASHDEAAWLVVVLQELPIRDDARSRIVPEHNQAHQRLWTDLSRLTTGQYVIAPASLLAFTAWQSGSGALANVALDRALAADPSYSMAVLLRNVINSGASPSLARLPMTPEEVAESYLRMESQDRVTAPGVDPQRAHPPRRAQVTTDSSDVTHPSVDFPNPVTPGMRSRPGVTARVAGQASLPPARRTL